MSKVQLHKIEKGKGDRILDFFVAIGAISQVAIGIILIYQLMAYIDSNTINRQSTEVTKQALEAAHIPWLHLKMGSVSTVNDPTGTSHTFHLVFEIENTSDSPATHVSCNWEFVSQKGVYPPITYAFTNRTVSPEDAIFPREDKIYHFWGTDVVVPGQPLYNGVMTGRINCNATISFTDIIGKKFTEEVSMVFKNNEWNDLDVNVSGPFSGLDK